MRLAWFSPFPPTRSGIAAYSDELLPLLESAHTIDRFPESRVHDFAWMARRHSYDLVVYQLGNAPCHDYMWAYLAAYPGLVVLHDAVLHHARARQLLQARRADDYRRELAYDHPDARPGFADYAIEGLGGSIYYFWSMLRVVVRTARQIAVHSARVADDLRGAYPGAMIETIRMGVPPVETWDRAAARRALALPDRALLFAAFGKVTPEKRVAPILRALGRLVADGRDAHLLLVGDASEYPSLDDELAQQGLTDRVRVTGHVADADVSAHLAAADACVCLRWPTAQESSASWLRCLAARRATVLSDLAHLVDIPESAALRVDLLDEDDSLLRVMRLLADDRARRDAIADGGYEYWRSSHTLETMAQDYARVLTLAATRPAPLVADLPSHFTDDYSSLARAITAKFDLDANDARRASVVPKV
jgi:glycosyltransferase involved in cell wall biosynthesis